MLASIAPSYLRRSQAATKILEKCEFYENSLLYELLQDKTQQRLKSRKPIWQSLDSLRGFDLNREWKVAWENENLLNSDLIDDPTKKVSGYDLKRRTWITVNRIRTNHGRCNHSLHKWGLISSPSCDCGDLDQTISHIINSCPRRRFVGNIQEISSLSERAVDYLENLDIIL